MSLTDSLISTPSRVCVRSAEPTALPLLSLRSAWAISCDCALAANAKPATSAAAPANFNALRRFIGNLMLTVRAAQPDSGSPWQPVPRDHGSGFPSPFTPVFLPADARPAGAHRAAGRPA